MLILDASYTLEIIRERGLENSVLSRDLDGFFRHVWTVHPMASLLTSDAWAPRYGKGNWHQLSDRHTFVEGKVGRFGGLSRLLPVNFLLSQLLLFLQLRRLIRRERIAIVRAGDPLYLGIFGWALARSTGARFMIRVNGNNDKVRENTGRPAYARLFRSIEVEKRIERFVFPRCDLIAAPNQDNVDFAVGNGARADRVTIFRYGNLLAQEHLRDPEQRECDTEFFKSLRVTPGKYLLSVGRLEALKHPEDLMQVFAKVRAAGHDLDLVYAGDGSMRADLTAIADKLGVAEHVRFPGNQNQQQLAQLNSFATAVLSALTGRALSESALCGAPIVAYDLDWQGDLVETGITGELVPFRSTEAMAESVLKLLNDPDYARTMGKGARERALAMMDPERLNAHERAAYRGLLMRREPR
ncbi:MAG: glycosyltransferase [Sphingomicrobium sp.]